MSLADAFADLAASGASPMLLGNCKLEWAGTEIYGEEAIAEAFRAAPLSGDENTLFIESAHNAAWFANGSALFADLYDGRIGRLWRLGAGEPPAREPAVSVAFDPDLRQQRGAVLARAADHPLLDLAHLAPLEAAAAKLIAAPVGDSQHRARAFLFRAFSSGEQAAALFAVHRLSGGEVRSSSFAFAAVAITKDTPRITLDQQAPTDWTTRL